MILRSEPSSRAALMGEQPNPWDLLQPQDATSRHRTLAPHSCGSRLYLHPALVGEKGEGPAFDSGHRFTLRYGALSHGSFGRADQSLRGQTSCLERSRLPTVLSGLEFTVISWHYYLVFPPGTPQMCV